MQPIVLCITKIAKSPDLVDARYFRKDGRSGTWGVSLGTIPFQVDASPTIFSAVAGILCLIAKYLGGRYVSILLYNNVRHLSLQAQLQSNFSAPYISLQSLPPRAVDVDRKPTPPALRQSRLQQLPAVVAQQDLRRPLRWSSPWATPRSHPLSTCRPPPAGPPTGPHVGPPLGLLRLRQLTYDSVGWGAGPNGGPALLMASSCGGQC